MVKATQYKHQLEMLGFTKAYYKDTEEQQKQMKVCIFCGMHSNKPLNEKN